MEIINTRSDLHRYVSNQLEDCNPYAYSVDHETLVDIMTDRFADMQKELGFSYGEKLRDYSLEEFFDLVADC